MILLVLALAAQADPPGEEAAPAQLWAGEQVTHGLRKAPLLGWIATTTTIRTLAHVVEQGGDLVIVDRPCTMEIHNTRGVDLTFAADTVVRMPPATSRFTPGADGWVAGPWPAGWGVEDVDGDGRAGVEVRVSAPICAGWLDVASRTRSQAFAQRRDGGLAGRVDVTISRDILGASNACLRLIERHQDETVSGWFAFVPVAADATCTSLGAAGWPVTAPTE